MAAELNWFDQRVKFRRADGTTCEGTPLDLTDGYADANRSIVSIVAGHPFVERGFEFLLQNVLQIAYPPADDYEWTERLFEPPTPEELRTSVEPYREAFYLDHPTHPALQLRPSQALLPPADTLQERQEKNLSVEPEPIAALLPDTPTKEAMSSREVFFQKGGINAISGGLVLPALYAHAVMFPSAGGGYYGMPYKSNAVRYQLVGKTLWECVHLNVLSKDSGELSGSVWPAPLDATVFSWLNDRLRHLYLGQIKKPERKKLEECGKKVPDSFLLLKPEEHHPAAIVTCRRYLLMPAEAGFCDLSGVAGPVFTRFQRWQNGPRPTSKGWATPTLSARETYERMGDGSPSAMPSDVEFLDASGPLRFDDWLLVALGHSQEWKTKKSVKCTRLPPILNAFGRRRDILAAAIEDEAVNGQIPGATALGNERPFRLRAFNAFNRGEVIAGTSERELPLYYFTADLAPRVAAEVARAAAAIGRMADALGERAAEAVKLGRSEGNATVPGELKDALMARLDEAVVGLVGEIADVYRHRPDDRDAAQEATNELIGNLLRRAQDEALRIFDEAFAVEALTEIDDMAVKLLRAREQLRRKLFNILRKQASHG